MSDARVKINLCNEDKVRRSDAVFDKVYAACSAFSKTPRSFWNQIPFTLPNIKILYHEHADVNASTDCTGSRQPYLAPCFFSSKSYTFPLM